jgi:Kef-type K+ transport system membrane component KefB
MPHVVQVLLLLALLVSAAKLAGALAARAGQPSVFGEILAGLLLGPSALNLLAWPLFGSGASPHPGADAPSLLGLVRDLSDIGVVLLMFVAGLETDLAEMRHVGAVAFWTALGGVLLPFVGGAAAAAAFGLPLRWEGVFVGAILTATSVSISAQTLIEIGQLRSREGSTILGAAVIDDVMGIVLLSAVVGFARASGAGGAAAIALAVMRMAAYFAGAVFVGQALGVLERFTRRLGVSQPLLAFAVAVAFVYAALAEWVGGVAAITGSYLAGVLFGRTEVKHHLEAGVHALTYSLFVPVFFVGIGLQANARDLGPHVGLTLTIVLVAIVAKALGCGLFARASGFGTIEAIRVGVGMISRGEVGLIVAGYGLSSGIIGRDVFSASVVMVLATTMVTPPLLRLTFPRRREADGIAGEEKVRAATSTETGQPG